MSTYQRRRTLDLFSDAIYRGNQHAIATIEAALTISLHLMAKLRRLSTIGPSSQGRTLDRSGDELHAQATRREDRRWPETAGKSRVSGRHQAPRLRVWRASTGDVVSKLRRAGVASFAARLASVIFPQLQRDDEALIRCREERRHRRATDEYSRAGFAPRLLAAATANK